MGSLADRIGTSQSREAALSEDEKGYNGWSNYPTWAVNLWLSNDHVLYTEALERTIAVCTDIHPTSEYWSVEESQRYGVADMLKEWVEELAEDAQTKPVSMVADLIRYALGEVDWNEIADSWIDQVGEQS